MSSAAVDIVIPTYNRAGILREAIDSVRAQTVPSWELIVVDDGSTDATAEVVGGYASRDPRVHLLRQANGGLAEARNAGIRAGRAPYVAFLDDDDLWLPEKLELQLRCMEGPSQPGLCYTLAQNVDMATGAVYRVVPEAPGRTYTELFLRNFVPCPSVMVRRDCLERVGLFDKRMNPAEDWDLWLRIAREYPLDFAPYPVTVYRRHGHNMSDKTLQMFEADARAILRREGDHRLGGGEGLWRARLAGARYELARCAIDQRRWAAACAALARAILRWPGVGLTAKRYVAQDLGRPIYDAVKPYLALGYCALRAAYPFGRRTG